MKRGTTMLAAVCFFLCWTRAVTASGHGADKGSLGQIKLYHDRSIRDLSAIGSRNVGCARGLGNWYSIEKQMRNGQSVCQAG